MTTNRDPRPMTSATATSKRATSTTQANLGREPAEGRVDVSQPSDTEAKRARTEHEQDEATQQREPARRDGGMADPGSTPTGRTDLDTRVPNEGFGVEPDESDSDLREAIRREPPL